MILICKKYFEFQDLSKIVKLAKSKKIFTLDNAGHSLYLKPLKLGFDMSFSQQNIFRPLRCYGRLLAVNKSFKTSDAINFPVIECLLMAYLTRGLGTLDTRLINIMKTPNGNQFLKKK